VFGRDGFDERDPGLLGCRRIVANAARHDEELTGPDDDIAAIYVSASNAQLAAQYEEHFVLVGMSMPGEFSLDTRYLDELVIDLAKNSRRPKLRKSAAREFE
jgi:hypothetical protein